MSSTQLKLQDSQLLSRRPISADLGSGGRGIEVILGYTENSESIMVSKQTNREREDKMKKYSSLQQK